MSNDKRIPVLKNLPPDIGPYEISPNTVLSNKVKKYLEDMREQIEASLKKGEGIPELIPVPSEIAFEQLPEVSFKFVLECPYATRKEC